MAYFSTPILAYFSAPIDNEKKLRLAGEERERSNRMTRIADRIRGVGEAAEGPERTAEEDDADFEGPANRE